MTVKYTWPNFADNVIAQAEFRHQRYLINTSRSANGWIIAAVLMLAPAAIVSVILFGIGLFGGSIAPFLGVGEGILGRIAYMGGIMLLTMNIALYLVVILITMGLSSNSITREHDSKNWEVLLLTNVDSEQLVWGKWWASMQALWGDHLMLFVLRLGLVGGLVAFHSDRLPDGMFGLSPTITHLAILTVIMFLFTIIDAAFTTAMGVAVPLSNFPGAVVFALVLGIRAFTFLVAFWFADQIRLALINDGPYLMIALVGLASFLFGTWLSLRLGQVIAVRSHVSPAEY